MIDNDITTLLNLTPKVRFFCLTFVFLSEGDWWYDRLWYTRIVESANLVITWQRYHPSYNASDDVARGMKEVAEQAGKHTKEEFGEKAVENISRDLSEPQSRFIGKLRGEDVTLP